MLKRTGVLECCHDVQWATAVCVDADTTCVLIDMGNVDGDVRHVTEAGIAFGPLDNADTVTVRCIGDADTEELGRRVDAIQIRMKNRQALRPAIFVDKDKCGACHRIATADTCNHSFAEVCFASTQITSEQYDIATVQELPEVCAQLNGIGYACTHKIDRLYVHDAIVACSYR